MKTMIALGILASFVVLSGCSTAPCSTKPASEPAPVAHHDYKGEKA